MRLRDILKKELVALDLEASDKWEAIEEVVNLLVNNHDINQDDREKILESVFSRERSMSTGIGKGVGIPHATSDTLTEVLGAYARLKTPIDYDSIDGEPVQHLVLMLIPKSEYQNHIKTLASIARLMNREEARKSLKDASSPDEILDIISQSDAS